MKLNKEFWESRYSTKQTGWDIGSVSTPLKEYFDQLEVKDIKILIPGAGNAYEAEYLHNRGFNNVFIVDWAKAPLDNFSKRVPEFPKEHLIQADFFELESGYDLIIEQTFFCAIDPKLRKKYAEKVHELLNPGGKLVGLLFKIPLNTDQPPYGGNKDEYESLFSNWFDIKKMETAYNSIEPRKGNELFIILFKK